jgi:OmpA-OmpF porin, OOP family
MRRPLISLFAVAGIVALLGACAKEQPPPPPPPPPAQPAAAPPPQHQVFKVYFELDRANLTPEAGQIVANAAAAAKANPSANVSLVGKTDTSGTAAYNQGLSERRTATVRRALAGDGVADGRITGRSVGETELEVPTANHVKEPRNRVVTIDIGG